MRVSASPYVTTLYERPSIKPKTQTEQNSYSSIQNKAMAGQGATNPSSIWNELSQEYDIHNATFDELCTVSRKLYDSKQISLFEYGLLTFDLEKLYSKFTHQAVQHGKRDWIAEFEKRAEQELKVGNMLGYSNRKDIINILKRFDQHKR